jgi:DNA-binding response OmpR family regulator
VVLIEDNKTDQFLVQEAIQAHHLQVGLRVIEDGERAVAFVDALDRESNARPPQLFLLDLNLPRKSGSEVLARIRQSRKCARVPVVIVTSSDLETDRVASASLGATAYFRKPAGYEAFLKIGGLMRALLAA